MEAIVLLVSHRGRTVKSVLDVASTTHMSISKRVRFLDYLNSHPDTNSEEARANTMMKEAEAGEEILRGEPYILCGICKGMGTYGQHNSGEAINVSCEYCSGKGYIIRPAYREACLKLGRPLPTHHPELKYWASSRG